jgi:hypothetical protein
VLFIVKVKKFITKLLIGYLITIRTDGYISRSQLRTNWYFIRSIRKYEQFVRFAGKFVA